jgi:hypothetical protein
MENHMETGTMTDTLAIFRRLTEAGMPGVQAEILATEIFDLQRRGCPKLAATEAPPRYSKNLFWNWYVGNTSRHPFLNGIVTGLVLVGVEWVLIFPVFDRVVAHVCGH